MLEGGAGSRGKPVNETVISPSKGRYFPHKQQASLSRDACLCGIKLGTALSPGCHGFRRSNSRLVFAIRLLPSFADVDSAFEEGAVFDRDARRNHIAGERTITADVNAVARREIATNFSQHATFTGIDVGSDYSVTANGDAVSGKVDRAFHPAIDIQ